MKGLRIPEGYKWVDFSDKTYRIAAESIANDDIPLLTIAGSGGSGKSILYGIAYAQDPSRTLCLASTGVAAFNLASKDIPAVTIHSGLRLSPRPWYDPEKPYPKAQKMLESIDMLLIDECAMVNANLMDWIISQVGYANRLRSSREKKIRIVLFGDVMQLPPIRDTEDPVTAKLWNERYGDRVFFFNSPGYRMTLRRTVELYRVYRQQDEDFRDLLDEVRMGSASIDTVNEINRHVMDADDFQDTIGRNGMMYLAGTRRRVDELNARYEDTFRSRRVTSKTYDAYIDDDVEDFERDFPGLPESVELFIGEQVMCTANSSEGDYQNGTIGKVLGFSKKTGYPIVGTADGREFTVRYHEFTKYRAVADSDGGGIRMKKAGTAVQIACRPAYAVTYHKAQGLTLDAAYLDFSGWIAPGSIYLGLSRLRSISGLGVSKKIWPGFIKTEKEALEFFGPQKDAVYSEWPPRAREF